MGSNAKKAAAKEANEKVVAMITAKTQKEIDAEIKALNTLHPLVHGRVVKLTGAAAMRLQVALETAKAAQKEAQRQEGLAKIAIIKACGTAEFALIDDTGDAFYRGHEERKGYEVPPFSYRACEIRKAPPVEGIDLVLIRPQEA